MRELTFRGFLAKYVRSMSKQNTNSLFKLAAEADTENPRLREPLFLLALYSQKQDVLLRATKNTNLYAAYSRMAAQYTQAEMTQAFTEASPTLPYDYLKVWKSYLSQKNKSKSDEHTKELMRQKVMRLQQKHGVTNYRIYTDLKLNPGNLNAWLKHGDSEKVSLDTARKALYYVESRIATEFH